MAKLGPTEVNGSLGVNGIFTKPLQPAFSASFTSTFTLALAGTTYTLAGWTEQFDTGSNFNASTGIFTAPVAGNYQFSANIEFRVLQVNCTYYYATIWTSNTNVNCLKILNTTSFTTNLNYRGFPLSILMGMDPGDQAKLQVYQANGTANVTTITGSTSPLYTSFSGFLAC